ncbi:cyanophycinase [Pseudomonas xionganensis]|uniref:Cyanophycinase n=1 Tax=Pseudomonas xionganensis TaxID=2654845 RepID=A0A6I4KYT8_9PSED|nr:cyanophycinase [Pseudomonas xionganensis]MVW74933.1 cyanophycinase [Pseudomonas xionganensis]
MKKSFQPRGLFAALILSCASSVYAEGHLLAVGGMLRASNAPVYGKFVELAGGQADARIVILPTASGSQSSSKRFMAELVALGVPAERISIVGIDRHNYLETMNDAEVIKPLNEASAVWFVGGDQARIARALFNADGSPSLLMNAVRKVYDQGGVVAGTSAGASILGAEMPTAYGVVMDTLDFGVAAKADQRGTAILKGAGLFNGIIDQHLDQIEETSTGRAARMAAYLAERKTTKGFGLDTNTAMWVKPGGQLEVLGEGYLTVMDASQAEKGFGLYGTQLSNVRLAMLGQGDRYDLNSGALQPAEGKAAIEAGNEYLVGNQLITDLAAVSAMGRAVLYGLADNTASRQLGLMTRYNPLNGYHYGYRFEFSKTPEFSAHSQFYDSLTNYSVQGVRLDIRPVNANLGDPAASAPRDAGNGAQGDAIRAVSFRGLMTLNGQNAFEPQRAITRLELANALQMTLAAEPKLDKLPTLSDIGAEHPLHEQLQVVLSNGWMRAGAAFAGQQPVTRKDWALACKALVERFHNTTLEKTAVLNDLGQLDAELAEAARLTVGEGWLKAEQGRFEPEAPVSRAEVAQTLARIAGLLKS